VTDNHESKIPSLPDHEPGAVRLLADAGRPYRAFRTLAEAQADPDGVVVFEGDCGGEIYAVCPARAVRCSEDAVRGLLKEIDDLEWHDECRAGVFFESLSEGSVVAGGMGGGRVGGDLWIHPRLRDRGEAIKQVLDGKRTHLK
jgi:hypothetical protein